VLDSYRRLLETARKRATDDPDEGRRLTQPVADRAFEAEAALRVLLKECIDSLNELKDTGRLEAALRAAASKIDDDWKKQLREKLEKIQESLREIAGGEAIDLAGGAMQLVSERITRVVRDRDGLRIALGKGDDAVEFVLEPSPRPGHTGRISSDAFFSTRAGGVAFGPMAAVLIEPTCHHERAMMPLQTEDGIIDVYGAVLGNMAYAREAMYRHARKTAEIGLGAFKGKDVFTAIGIALVVAGAVALIWGYTNGDDEAITWGWIMLSVGVVFICQCPELTVSMK